jgi:hypothetical protein
LDLELPEYTADPPPVVARVSIPLGTFMVVLFRGKTGVDVALMKFWARKMTRDFLAGASRT